MTGLSKSNEWLAKISQNSSSYMGFMLGLFYYINLIMNKNITKTVLVAGAGIAGLACT